MKMINVEQGSCCSSCFSSNVAEAIENNQLLHVSSTSYVVVVAADEVIKVDLDDQEGVCIH